MCLALTHAAVAAPTPPLARAMSAVSSRRPTGGGPATSAPLSLATETNETRKSTQQKSGGRTYPVRDDRVDERRQPEGGAEVGVKRRALRDRPRHDGRRGGRQRPPEEKDGQVRRVAAGQRKARVPDKGARRLPVGKRVAVGAVWGDGTQQPAGGAVREKGQTGLAPRDTQSNSGSVLGRSTRITDFPTTPSPPG